MQIRPLTAVLLLVIGVVLTLAILFSRYSREEGIEATWTMVNVSGTKHSGSAHLLELPDNKTVLIDTGYRYFAEHDLLPLLQKKGIQKIDALVVTHAHRNHYGGIRELLKAGIRPEVVYFNLPPKDICNAETWATGCDYDHVLATFEMLKEWSIPIRTLNENQNIISASDGTVSLDVISVFDGINTPVGKTDINDTSAIMKLSVGDQAVLFAADLNKKIGAHLAKNGERLQADIMTAPHHGVESAAPDVFYDAVNPKTILASVSSPSFDGPRGKRLRDYVRRKGIPLYVSGRHGNVIVKFRQGSYTVTPERQTTSQSPSEKPDIVLRETHTGKLEHPAHVLQIGDNYIAAELFNDRLVMADKADFSTAAYIDKSRLISGLRSPHFISASIEPGILVSEGWGSNIVHIPDAINAPVTRFSGLQGDRFNAPHGVCQAKDGWIYVADSLNSRLVRYRQYDGSEFEVFADSDKLVSYGRQILCRDDGIWLSNSYERREGLNPGEGSNVLKIIDFESGKAEVVVRFRRANMTGIGIIDDRWLIVGLWSDTNQTLMVDLTGKETMTRLPRPGLIGGPPYGITVNEEKDELFISYPGDIMNKTDKGGYGIYTYTSK